MSEKKLLENKQLIHVISEVVVLFGITYYFSSKNKQLLGHIEELHHRIDEKDEQLEKFESELNNVKQMQMKLVSELQTTQLNMQQIFSKENQNRSSYQNKLNNSKLKNTQSVNNEVINNEEDDTKVENTNSSKQQSNKPIEFINPKRDILEPIEESEEVSITDDSELDKEIQEELNELVDNDVLKKED